MLISESSISELNTHVWLPMAEQASRRILQKLGLEEYFANNIFINSDYSGSSVSWKDKVTRYAMLNEQKMHVNVKFNNNVTNLKWDVTTVSQHMDPMVHRRDVIIGKPLFLDIDTGIHIIERGMPANIEMECQLVFNDSVVAFDAVAAFLNTFNRGELMEVMNLEYDYQMPLPILKDLWILGQMKGLKRGEFMDWFCRCSDNRIQLIQSKRVNNRHHELVVKKRAYEALMSIDYNPEQPAIQSSGTAAEAVILMFNITLQMTRPNMMYLKYPIVVNNQLVPKELVHVADDDLYNGLIYRLHHPVASYDIMWRDTRYLLTKPLRMPWYDDWTIPQGSQLDDRNIFVLLTSVLTFDDDACRCCHKDVCTCECEHKYTTIDLYEDLDIYKLTDKVKTWFKENPTKALDVDSVFNLSVWCGDRQIEPSRLIFDGRYLKIPNTLKRDKVHRLVFARTRQFTWDKNAFANVVVDNYNSEPISDNEQYSHRPINTSEVTLSAMPTVSNIVPSFGESDPTEQETQAALEAAGLTTNQEVTTTNTSSTEPDQTVTEDTPSNTSENTSSNTTSATTTEEETDDTSDTKPWRRAVSVINGLDKAVTRDTELPASQSVVLGKYPWLFVMDALIITERES